jgi:hypothetical protein
MLDEILVLVNASHFEIVSPRPLWLTFHLVPAVNNFSYLDEPLLQLEAARGLIGLGPGVAFDLDGGKLHGPPA